MISKNNPSMIVRSLDKKRPNGRFGSSHPREVAKRPKCLTCLALKASQRADSGLFQIRIASPAMPTRRLKNNSY
jgi:hypothetical protein